MKDWVIRVDSLLEDTHEVWCWVFSKDSATATINGIVEELVGTESGLKVETCTPVSTTISKSGWFGWYPVYKVYAEPVYYHAPGSARIAPGKSYASVVRGT